MKIHAAQRLKVMATADEAMARTYLKATAGITVGKLYTSSPNSIVFFITTEQFEDAKQQLSKQFKWKPSTIHGSSAGSVDIDHTGTRRIELSTVLARGGGELRQPWIALVDTNHKESMSEMMKRILAPARRTVNLK